MYVVGLIFLYAGALEKIIEVSPPIIGVIYVAKSFMKKHCSEGTSRKLPMEKKEERSRTWNGCVNNVEKNSLS